MMAAGKLKYNFKDRVYVWMLVTQDRYSLPLLICDTGRELAKACGVKPNTVFHHISLHESGRLKGYPKYIRVVLEKGESDG